MYRYDTYRSKLDVSWNEIFAAVSPIMIDETTENAFLEAINQKITTAKYTHHVKNEKFENMSISEFSIFNEDFKTIKVQLRALGLIDKSVKPRSVKDTQNYWSLTEFGDVTMNKLIAIKNGKK